MQIPRFGRALAVMLALSAVIGLAATSGGLAVAQKKVVGHPNLAAAQKLAAQAFDKLEAAQKANEYDLGGHAAKAKTLLKQVNDEIKLAADAADASGGDKSTRKKSD